MARPSNLSILGGGPAGLAVGYFASKAEIPFTIYETSDHTGGNAITLQHGEFRFDSGAHRFHDKDPQVTQELMELMGDELRRIVAPSQIYHQGKFINFPLHPFNLLTRLGAINFIKAGIELLAARLNSGEGNGSFESFATRMYGKTLAELFLLSYSEKLWGQPCDTLSPSISGMRLKGLDLGTFLKETFLGKKAKTDHFEGSFYYPNGGYGAIVDNLAEVCGSENIRINSRISKILHEDNRIQSIEINNDERIVVDQVVSTLPLSLLIRLLEPKPNDEILELASRLRFRNLILIVLFLDRAQISENASIYIPDPKFPFTRIYEPKNRSEVMAPPGKTSLCVEIPCDPGDAMWNDNANHITSLVISNLIQLEMIHDVDIVGSVIHKMSNAYPVLDLGFEKTVEQLYRFLQKFQNLRLSGRNGRFLYTHMHDMLRFGLDLVNELKHSPVDS